MADTPGKGNARMKLSSTVESTHCPQNSILLSNKLIEGGFAVCFSKRFDYKGVLISLALLTFYLSRTRTFSKSDRVPESER